MIPSAKSRSGFTIVELMVGMVVGALALAGIYTLWKNHHEQTLRLQAKIEARNQLTLSAKALSRAITLAGLGMAGAPGLIKEDAVGTDTLILYTNPGEASTGLLADYQGGNTLSVRDGNLFSQSDYVGISDGKNGEIRPLAQRGSVLVLNGAFEFDYDTALTRVYPASREKFYTDQVAETLVHATPAGARIAGRKVRNFQVSFRDGDGESTEDFTRIRSVQFSLTGVFPAREGALNSIVYSSAAIPRNML